MVAAELDSVELDSRTRLTEQPRTCGDAVNPRSIVRTARFAIVRADFGLNFGDMDEGKVELIPQPHGGALQRGNPGNRGGVGRPPNVAVRRADEDLKLMLERLRAAARDERTPARDLVQIARLFVEIANRIDPPAVPPSAVLRLSAEEMQRELEREAAERAAAEGEPVEGAVA